jgi:GTP-binding protein
MKVTVALVGRPNVGKSRLFNRLVGRRVSIVHDQPGVTRDLIVREIDGGIVFMDTGGMGFADEENTIVQAVEEQIAFAIQAADIIFFIVDARTGCTALDHEIAEKLRKADKKIFLIANKIDSEGEIYRSDAFHALGFGHPIAVSAEHGYGEDDMWEILQPHIHRSGTEIVKSNTSIRICLAGRPNVGKSSIANAFLKYRRMIVTPIAGTTRDAIDGDFTFEHNGQTYSLHLTDTAGLREKKKLGSSVEFFSSLRSTQAMDSADLILLVIDALSGITRQDKKLVDRAIQQGKCLIVLVNKWDLAAESIREERIAGFDSIESFQESFTDALRRELFILTQFPIFFISAKTGFGLDVILQESICLHERASQTIATGRLNHTLQNLIERHPPAFMSGKRFKIYYAVQSGCFPFRLKIFCNRLRHLMKPSQQYLEKGLRAAFDLVGCPLIFDFVEKEARYGEKAIEKKTA